MERRIGSVVFGDTKRGASHSRGWWTVCSADDQVLGVVAASEDRERDGKVFTSSLAAFEVRAEALAAARQYLPRSAALRPGEFGFDAMEVI